MKFTITYARDFELTGFERSELKRTKEKKTKKMTGGQGYKVPGIILKLKRGPDSNQRLFWISLEYAKELEMITKKEDIENLAEKEIEVKNTILTGEKIRELSSHEMLNLRNPDLEHTAERSERESTATTGKEIQGVLLKIGPKIGRKNFVWMSEEMFKKAKFYDENKQTRHGRINIVPSKDIIKMTEELKEAA